jgi:hypothetical protein
MEIVKSIKKDGRSLYISTSLGGGAVPPSSIVKVSDYVLLHGNGVRNPERITEMIRQVREMKDYHDVPIIINEDDQPWIIKEQGWEDYGNNMAAAVQNYASWGYFDFRPESENELFNEGFQSVPVNWQISSQRKLNFFNLLAEITGYPGTPKLVMEWSDEPGKVTVKIKNSGNSPAIDEVSLLINNQVIDKISNAPYRFEINKMPDYWHQVKARAHYRSGEHKIIIETPVYENPWWLYGGAKRNKPSEP